MKVLIGTVPLTGHVHPMLLVARRLVERGHQVVWYGASKFAAKITATGARFAGPGKAPDIDDAKLDEHPALAGKRGLRRVKAQLAELFINPMIAQYEDMEALANEHRPDLVLADQAHLGASLLAEKRGLRWAGLGISTLVFSSVDTAPFGAARPPAKNDGERKVYRFVRWIVHGLIFRSVTRAFKAQRVAAGLPAGETSYFDVLAPDLFLQPTIPEMEYPRSDLPPQVTFVGPLVPPNAGTGELPAWWPDVEAARAAGTPIILVTQGTMATNPKELIAPALKALANEDVLVVATTAATATELGFPPPANARLAAYVPYQALLPHTAVMVTNGGYGGVQMALAHAVPMVIAGGSEEKPEIAARVAWAGVGLDLRTGRPRAKKILRAVRRVLDENQFKTRAAVLAAACAGHDPVTEAVSAIEALGEVTVPKEAA